MIFRHDVLALCEWHSNAALLYSCISEILSTRGEKWGAITIEEIKALSGLTFAQQRTARKKLKEAGLLHEKHQGLPCRLFFKVVEVANEA